MAPPIASHPRFKLGRVLMTGSGGGPEEAIDVFCALLEEAIERASRARAVGNEGDGPPGDGLDAALAEYEYGNALFRAVVRREEDGGGEENADSWKPAADPAEDGGGKKAGSRRRR
ncbi:hypothetical protein THAOC_07611, partial [Thalassiosira oceanica]